MKAGFRNTQWDPIMLISQIVAMQSLLYVSLGAVMFLMDLLAGANHTLDHIFQYHVITNSSKFKSKQNNKNNIFSGNSCN